MQLNERLLLQIEEARSPVNRYYFGLKHNREATNDEELILFYIESGGAENFARKEVEYEKVPLQGS